MPNDPQVVPRGGLRQHAGDLAECGRRRGRHLVGPRRERHVRLEPQHPALRVEREQVGVRRGKILQSPLGRRINNAQRDAIETTGQVTVALLEAAQLALHGAVAVAHLGDGVVSLAYASPEQGDGVVFRLQFLLHHQITLFQSAVGGVEIVGLTAACATAEGHRGSSGGDHDGMDGFAVHLHRGVSFRVGAGYASFATSAYRPPYVPRMNPPRTRRFRFAAAIDASGVIAAPADAVIEFDEATWPACRLIQIESARAGDAIERTDEVLLPAFVNAHTHLDLTHIGPRPYDPRDGFDSWLRMILSERRHDDAGIRASVLHGVERCLAGAVVAVGDIAGVGRTEPLDELRASPLIGESYIEFFGLGARQRETVDEISALVQTQPADAGNVRLALSPHAPYTAGPDVYARAAAADLPVCTHLAESDAERRFIETGDGPMRKMLDALGVLDDDAMNDFARGQRPVAHLEPALRAQPWLLAHVCDATDDEIAFLSETDASVAYCPRSSHYFAHHAELGPHRYRDMLAAGVSVCLGTDSIVNLPLTSRGKLPTLGVLDEMRFLHERDATDPLTLLAMATVNGAAALSLDPARFMLTPGEKGGLSSVRAAGATLEAVLASTAQAELLTP